ncbi:hypothetical protein [Streptomyces sp. CC228A]|uniref:hypothetical protein n=1 Tax=Streptomyces sp. CC228A TaxID=2898186 RepID=UPI001F397E77|nr:hypothetical protein [Streptomyces sp. CC228A]
MTAQQTTVTAGGTPSGRPARPAGYWERIDRIVAAAPPLSDEQRAALRTIFHQARTTREAA